MFQWFANLPPGEQIALLGQVFFAVFSAGVYAATIRSLSKDVVELKKTAKEHTGKLEEHGEAIAEIRGSRHAAGR